MNETLYQFIRDWVVQVVNTELGNTFPIIRAFQNAPAPTGRYLAISSEFTRKRMGTSRKGCVDTITGLRPLTADYEFTGQIYEVNGDGDLLSTIIESRDRSDIFDLFNENNVSLLRNTDVTPTPRLKDSTFFIKEHSIQLIYGALNTIQEDVGVIETVNYTNEIGQ